MKRLLVLAAALVAAPTAYGAGFYEAKVLEPAASYVAKKPVKVWCASSEVSWDAFVVATNGDNIGEHGLADIPRGVMHLDPTVCSILRSQLAYGREDPSGLAPSIEVVTHEAIHLRGERDEGVTDCAAIHEMPGAAARFFHIRAGKQLRDLMTAAWAWRGKLSPPFRTVC